MTSRYDPKHHRRQSLRLKGYDYTQAGAYFVTMVAQNRSYLFGEIAGEEMWLGEAGEMVRRAWEALPRRFPGIEVDAFVVMPNHVHGIVVINQPVGVPLVGAQIPDAQTANTEAATGATSRVAPTTMLGDVVGAYKSLTTVEYIRGVKTITWPPVQGGGCGSGTTTNTW